MGDFANGAARHAGILANGFRRSFTKMICGWGYPQAGASQFNGSGVSRHNSPILGQRVQTGKSLSGRLRVVIMADDIMLLILPGLKARGFNPQSLMKVV